MLHLYITFWLVDILKV